MIEPDEASLLKGLGGGISGGVSQDDILERRLFGVVLGVGPRLGGGVPFGAGCGGVGGGVGEVSNISFACSTGMVARGI